MYKLTAREIQRLQRGYAILKGNQQGARESDWEALEQFEEQQQGLM